MSKTVKFSKYHGTGNDFIMIDGSDFDINALQYTDIQRLCNRHFGIGADGLIHLEPVEGYDFRMNYFNADGHLGSMCGNGGRCAVAFARDLWKRGAASRRRANRSEAEVTEIGRRGDWSFLASDGEHRAKIENDVVELSLNDVNGVKRYDDGVFMDTGSPHLMVFVDDVDKVDIGTEGRRLRHDDRFEKGTNVNFVQLQDGFIHVRTFERGVEDETLSCGTGITAAAIAAFLENPRLGQRISVKARGGELSVSFHQKYEEHFTNLLLSGPTAHVFDGSIEF